MKCIILAGGQGTRLSEITKRIPKPMIKVKGEPIIVHIINHYKKFGIKDFIIAAGYKCRFIQKYFRKKKKDLNIKVINTGLKSMTGGRLKRLKKILKNDSRFFLTYGDGLSNVNIKKLLKLHIKKNNLATLTAVRPPARFGVVKIKNGKVSYFKEKSSSDEGWINGGFFVFENDFLKYIKNDSTFLEREPLEKVCKQNKLGAYKHYGFWQCVDTNRDLIRIKKIFKNKIEK